MSLTTADLTALDAAIAASELEVQINGRRVKYRSTDELLKARAHVAEVVANAGGGRRTGPFRFRFTTSRGD